MIVRFEWMEGADPSLGLPAYETVGAAGADLRANIAEDIVLKAGERALVSTGLRMAIDVGFEVQIRARSGLAYKHGIGLVNGIGTIDSDYRGPVGVLLINWGAADFVVRNGDRIAQMVVAPVVQGTFELGDLNATARGEGGFGSTGAN